MKMTTSISLTKTLALAMVSHLAITAASFASENDDLTTATLSSSTPPKVEVQQQEATVAIDTQNIVAINTDDIEAQIPLTATQTLDNKGEEASAAVSKLDTLIKYGIIAGGIAAGTGLACFYGPAFAFATAYKGSLFLAALTVPNPTWYTYNCIIQPAAIDAGIYFANSALTNATIGAVATGLGYGLGKAGCAAYDGAKYVAGATASTAYNATKYVASAAGSAGYALASKAGEIAIDVAPKIASAAGSTASSLASTISSKTSNMVSSAWNWFSGAATVA